MLARFIFQIHPLSIEQGFELTGEGIIPQPLHFQRFFEAILAVGQIGQGLEAEVRIFDTTGAVIEVMELNRHAVLAD